MDLQLTMASKRLAASANGLCAMAKADLNVVFSPSTTLRLYRGA